MLPPMPAIATLLVSCPDRRGIVATLAQLLYGHGANILDSDQHSDPDGGQFVSLAHYEPPGVEFAQRARVLGTI